MDSNPVRIEELLAHAGWVRELAARLVRDAGTADDVTQEVWAYALRSPPGDRRNLRGWLAEVVHNAARSFGRSESRRAARESATTRVGSEESTDELVERGQLHRQLVEQVMALDEPYRSIVLAHWFEGEGIREIARRLGLTPKMARTRLDAAHARLRQRMDEAGGGRAAWSLAFVKWIAPRQAAAVGGVLMATKITAAVTTGVVVLLGSLAAWTFWPTSSELTASAGPNPSLAVNPSMESPSGSPTAQSVSREALLPELEIVVQDECERPISGATLTTGKGEQAQLLGTTNDLGRVTIPASTGVEVRHAGFVPTTVQVSGDRSSTLVTLLTTNVVSGRVSSSIPGFRPETVTVYALESKYGDVRIDGVRMSRVAGSAKAAPDGSFRLPCLDPSLSYSIIAGGNGWVCSKRDVDPWPFRRVGEGDAHFDMRHLRAAILEIHDQFGEPAHISATADKSGFSAPVEILPGGRVEYLSAEYIAAGASMSWLELPEGSLLRLHLDDHGGSDPEPKTLELRAPGYDDATFSYVATEVGRPVEPQACVVHRNVVGFGTIRLRFLLGDQSPAAVDACPMGTLRLQPEAGSALEYGITPANAELDVCNVPCGAYQASFTPLFGSTTVVERAVRVEPAGSVEWVIPMDGFGSVRVVLTTPSGAEYDGSFSYMLRAVAQDSSSGKSSSRGSTITGTQFHPPYVLRGLQAGTYEFSSLSPKPRDDAHATQRGIMRVEVRGGEASTITLAVGEP